MTPTATSASPSFRWDDLRIVPIRSDFIAPRFCRLGRVSQSQRRAALQRMLLLAAGSDVPTCYRASFNPSFGGTSWTHPF